MIVPMNSGGTDATSLAMALTRVSSPGPACAAPCSRLETASAMEVNNAFVAGPCARAYSKKLAIGPEVSPSDRARIKWIALSVAPFSVWFAKSPTFFDTASNEPVLMPPPRTVTNRSSSLAAPFTIGVSFGSTAPITANDFSTGAIVTPARESDQALAASFRLDQPAAARCVASGMPFRVSPTCADAFAAWALFLPYLVTAWSYLSWALEASLRLEICGLSAAPNAASASPAAPACTAIGAKLAATGTAAGASDSSDPRTSVIARSIIPPERRMSPAAVANRPFRSRRRPLISRKPAAVWLLTRTVIVTSSDIGHLPSVVACSTELLDRHEAEELGVFLHQGGERVAREPFQQAE
jgi:hypothetical protein